MAVNNGVLVRKSTRGKFGWRVVLFVVPAMLFETVRQKVSHYNVTYVHMGVQKKIQSDFQLFCFCFVVFV